MATSAGKTGTRTSKNDDVGELHRRIAQSLEGRAVCLQVDARTIARGIVTRVMTETDIPKIVVEGMQYDLEQILTATPPFLFDNL
jgi:hypothetical protein